MTGRSLLLVVFALLAVVAQAAPPPRAAAPATTLLVLPFENTGQNPRLDWIGEGLAELTRERLGGEGRFVYPRETWAGALEKLGLPSSRHFSRATMIKIADEADADAVIFGRYASDGQALRVSAQFLRLDEPGTGGEAPTLSPLFEESGNLSDLMEIHARLAWRLVRFQDPAFSLSQQEFVDHQPRLRLDAFELYIRGQSAMPGTVDDQQRLRLFREAAHLEPGWPDPAFALGRTYYAQRDCATALIWFSKVAPEHERGLEAGFLAGVCHLWRNDPARAEAAFDAVLERALLPEALNNLGIARARQGRIHDAVDPLRRATELDPEEPDYWFNLGVSLLSAAAPAEEKKGTRRGSLSPAPVRLALLKDAALTDNHISEPNPATAAVHAFREMLLRKPRDAEGRSLLAAALALSGKSSEAENENETAPAPPQISPTALASRYRAKTRLQIPTALSATALASSEGSELEGKPQTAGNRQLELLMSRGRQLEAAGRLDQAEHAFQRVLRRAPNYAAARRALAEVYGRQGKIEDATRELRASLAFEEDSGARVALARLYLQQNRAAEAAEELRAALKDDPENTEARQLLHSIEAPPGTGDPQ